ncbi:MAG: hypothetical protein OXI25_05020 [Chloroflexota bacterium]|nr:hypothetical protein [Chloroflexota bacterium]
MKSRFAIVGALAALLLALLYVAPVLASQSWTRIGNPGADGLGVAVLDPAVGATTTVNYGSGVPTDTTDDLTLVGYNTTNLPGGELAAQAASVYTKVGNTVWVAAAGGTPWTDAAGADAADGTQPYSLVWVSLTFASGATPTGTVTADVRNITSGRAVTGGDLTGADSGTGRTQLASPLWQGRLLLAGGGAGPYTGHFFVTKTQMELVGAQASIVGGENDVIQITAGGRVRTVRVDATPPSISGTGPAHETIQTGTSATFTGSITDTGSGIAPDVGGEDASAADGDGDGVTTEPRAEVNGGARDIEINVGTGPSSLLDVSLEASTGWSAVDNGFRFAFTKAGLVTRSGDVHWNVVAKDRVNNSAQTDADGAAGSNNNYLLRIDGANPGMGMVEAGIGYSASAKGDVPNARSIKVTFTADGNTPTTGAGNNADWLDAASVDEADFRVEASRSSASALAIAGVQHPNHGTMGGAQETRNVVYILLEDPLASNAQPEVNLIGTIRDLAGRAAPPSAVEARESIAPNMRAVVTGPPDARPVVKGTATDKALIRVTSDEELVRAPSVYLVNFRLNASDASKVEVSNVQQLSGVAAVTGSANTWEVQTGLTGAISAGLVGVYVVGTDRAIPANTGRTGGVSASGTNGAPMAGDAADLTKVELFEFDNSLAKPTFLLTPNTNPPAGRSTENSNPFLRINFAEGMENSLTNGTDTSDRVSFGTPPVAVEVDSHNGVTLTKLTITDSDGVSTDLLGQEGDVDADSFIIALSDLEKGIYTVHVNGTDAAGNSLSSDEAYALSVVARAPFAVSLSPGFNLISVPGDPANPSLDAVLPSSHPATTVLAFAPTDPNGPWLTATRSAGMDWSDNASNTLSEVRAGNGYWVETNAFVGLSTLINERSAAAVPPTYGVYAGWNLLGVTDVTLQKAGTKVSIDTYLASTPWSVAYTYDTQSNRWTKHSKGGSPATIDQATPLGAGEAAIGQGMWVYMSADGALAP